MSEFKTVELNIIKKNRAYFLCNNGKGYDIFLRIDENSQNLNLGKNTLYVRDETVRSNYGTKVIFSLVNKEVKKEEMIVFSAKYNKYLVDTCREMGVKWDSVGKCWVFPGFLTDAVEELELLYNTDICMIEIKAIREGIYGYKGPYYFCGIPIVKAYDRDSGAKVCDNVSMISGKISSGGSHKNWSTEIEKGSTFRFEISKNLLKLHMENHEEDFEIKII